MMMMMMMMMMIIIIIIIIIIMGKTFPNCTFIILSCLSKATQSFACLTAFKISF